MASYCRKCHLAIAPQDPARVPKNDPEYHGPCFQKEASQGNETPIPSQERVEGERGLMAQLGIQW